jgi:hypothetical protein
VDPAGSTFTSSISSFEYDNGIVAIEVTTPYEQYQDLTDSSINNFATVTSFEWVGAASTACDSPVGAGPFVPMGVSDSCEETWLASNWAWTDLITTCGAFARQQTTDSVIYSAELKISRTYVVTQGRISDTRVSETRHLLSVVFPLVLDVDTTQPIVIYANNVNWNGNMILRSLMFDRNAVLPSVPSWVAVFRGSSGYPYKLSPLTGTLNLFKQGFGTTPVAAVTALTDCLASSPVNECWQDLTVRFEGGCAPLSFDATNYLYLGPSTLSFQCRDDVSATECPFTGSRPLSTTQNAVQVSNLVTTSACATTFVNIEQPFAELKSYDSAFSADKRSFVDGDVVGMRLILTMPGAAGKTDAIQGSKVMLVSSTDLGGVVLQPSAGSYIPEAAVTSAFCQDTNGLDLPNVVCFTINTGVAPFPGVAEGQSATYRFTVKYEVTLQGSAVTKRFTQEVAVQKTYVNATSTTLPFASKTAASPVGTGTVGGPEGMTTVVWILAGVLAAVLIVVIGSVAFWRYRKYRTSQTNKRMEKEDLEVNPKKIEVQELEEIGSN